ENPNQRSLRGGSMPGRSGPGRDWRNGCYRRARLWKDGAIPNPVKQRHDFFERQRFLAFGRHHVVMLRRQKNQLDDAAADGVAGLDGDVAAFPAFDREFWQIETIAALLLVRSVAFVTLGL